MLAIGVALAITATVASLLSMWLRINHQGLRFGLAIGPFMLLDDRMANCTRRNRSLTNLYLDMNPLCLAVGRVR